MEFESRKAHLLSVEHTRQVTEMLYQDKTLGKASIGAKLLARLAAIFGGKRYQDLDLLSVSPHLRRDIGLDRTELGVARDDWRWK